MKHSSSLESMEKQIWEMERNQSDQFFESFVTLQLCWVYGPTDLEMRRIQSHLFSIYSMICNTPAL